MDIIIVGAGEVGYHLARRFSEERHNIIIIDSSQEKKESLEKKLDVMVIMGNGADPAVLKKAQLDHCEMFIGATNSDEVNMVSSFIAKENAVPLTIARIQTPMFFENLPPLTQNKLGIDVVINTRTEVAKELCRMIELPGVSNTVYFADEKVQLIEIQITPDDDLVDTEIRDFQDLRSLISFLVVAILRDGKIIIPGGQDTVREGDKLFIIGQRQMIPEIMDLLGKRYVKTRSVMISGGGHLGRYLAEMLMEKDIEVKIIEKDNATCEFLSSQLKKAVIIKGESTELTLLEQEGIARTDVFVAVTDDEEVNVLSTVLAKRANAPRGIALINRPDYSLLIPALGIDAVIIPRTITANAILKYVRKGDILSAVSFGEDKAEVVEILIDQSSDVVGKPLSQLKIPGGSLIGAILHQDEAIIPGGDNVIHANDRVIIFAKRSAVTKVEKFFGK